MTRGGGTDPSDRGRNLYPMGDNENDDVTLDSAFGTNGEVITDLGILHQESSAVELQADGKIVLAGTSNHNFTLMRYWRNGRLDHSFGGKGIVITDVGNGRGECTSIAIQPDGKMVLAGYSGSKYVILRYKGDSTFVAKTRTNNFSNFQGQNNAISKILVSPNPVKDILYVERLSSATKTISILDMKGRLVLKATTSNSSYSFNTKDLSSGIYFVTIQTKQGRVAEKLVKL